jgi:hypothetical protein
MTKANGRSRSTQQRKFNRSRFQWLAEIVGDPKLPAFVFKVAYFLADKFNRQKGGLAWPSLQTIADAVALSKSSVFDAIELLKSHGYLEVESGKQGRGHSNHYQMGAGKGRSTELLKGRYTERKGRPTELNLLSIQPTEGFRASGRRERDACFAGSFFPGGRLRGRRRNS